MTKSITKHIKTKLKNCRTYTSKSCFVEKLLQVRAIGFWSRNLKQTECRKSNGQTKILTNYTIV